MENVTVLLLIRIFCLLLIVIKISTHKDHKNCFFLYIAEDVVIERIEPDPATQEFLCPHQIVQYKCQTLIQATALTWRLPSGDTLPDFTGGSSVGRVRNSSDD